MTSHSTLLFDRNLFLSDNDVIGSRPRRLPLLGSAQSSSLCRKFQQVLFLTPSSQTTLELALSLWYTTICPHDLFRLDYVCNMVKIVDALNFSTFYSEILNGPYCFRIRIRTWFSMKDIELVCPASFQAPVFMHVSHLQLSY
jgi:hypothetical protein